MRNAQYGVEKVTGSHKFRFDLVTTDRTYYLSAPNSTVCGVCRVLRCVILGMPITLCNDMRACVRAFIRRVFVCVCVCVQPPFFRL